MTDVSLLGSLTFCCAYILNQAVVFCCHACPKPLLGFLIKYVPLHYVVLYFNLTGFYLILDFLHLSPPSLVI
jgi:hypothetical protein